MQRVLLPILLLATTTCGSAVESSGARGQGGDASGGAGGLAAGGAGGSVASESVAWIGAHPDDELYAAPYLASLCLDEGARCKLIVMTRGEAGQCKLPEPCLPDLATVRDAELAASAALFGADLVHWDLGDGLSPSPESVINQWAQGELDDFVAQLAAELAGVDRVVTFDPRHGDSCHADHRAAGALTIAAAASAGIGPSRVHLVASRLILEPAVPLDPQLYTFDASAVLATTGEPAWATLVDVLQAHASQFTPDDVAQV
ncbi:MAG: PIG-L family deacetylase, partial [Polyangiaceae bacterium]